MESELVREYKLRVRGLAEVLNSDSSSDVFTREVAIDVLGPIPRSRGGFSFILIAVDIASKFVIIHPIEDTTTSSVVNCLKGYVFKIFGVPSVVITDDALPFISNEFEIFITESNTCHGRKSGYSHAKLMGRVSGLVKTILRRYVLINGSSWDEFIPEIGSQYQVARQEATELEPRFVVVDDVMEWSNLEPPEEEMSSQQDEAVGSGYAPDE